MPQSQTKSHYPDPGAHQQIVQRTLSVLVDNEPGVLARLAGLFSGRGYNIDSLTVTETEHDKHLSRFTIVTKGTPSVIEQIKHQLHRMVPVHRVIDLILEGEALEREVALVKVVGQGDKRIEALRLAEIFHAEVIDASTGHFVFQLTGLSVEIERFIGIMTDLGLVEVS
ncbi:MAG TPA: acetolactate synthase small subunit, partial [Hyphomicrobiaceae bacterium]|nr:acetolactate synthase small subunit [Hyphomicrobiaceae bacterium]